MTPPSGSWEAGSVDSKSGSLLAAWERHPAPLPPGPLLPARWAQARVAPAAVNSDPWQVPRHHRGDRCPRRGLTPSGTAAVHPGSHWPAWPHASNSGRTPNAHPAGLVPGAVPTRCLVTNLMPGPRGAGGCGSSLTAGETANLQRSQLSEGHRSGQSQAQRAVGLGGQRPGSAPLGLRGKWGPSCRP